VNNLELRRLRGEFNESERRDGLAKAISDRADLVSGRHSPPPRTGSRSPRTASGAPTRTPVSDAGRALAGNRKVLGLELGADDTSPKQFSHHPELLARCAPS